MSDVSNLSDTIVPKSDQLNSEQLIGGPLTITVTNVRRGTDDQPVIINYKNDEGRPYKPCKTMRKVLIFAWGDDGRDWIGKSMTLFNNPDVKFGGVKVGGIRISHLSDIERDIALTLTATKGRKEPVMIKKMTVKTVPSTPTADPAPTLTEGPDDDLTAIRECESMADLQRVFGSASKEWKKAGHDLTPLIKAKDQRKDELTNVVEGDIV